MGSITINEKDWERLNFVEPDTVLFYFFCKKISTEKTKEQQFFVFNREDFIHFLPLNPMKYKAHLKSLYKEGLIDIIVKDGMTKIKIIEMADSKNEKSVSVQAHQDKNLESSNNDYNDASSFNLQQVETNLHNKNSRTIKKTKFKYSEKDMELALYIKDKVSQIRVINKRTNIEEWASIIRKMYTFDNIEYNLIKKVFDFAHNDSFWSSNILSPRKLRDKFETLIQKSGLQPKLNQHNKLSFEEPPYDEIKDMFQKIIGKEAFSFNEQEIKTEFYKTWFQMMKTKKRYSNNPNETMYFDKKSGIIWWEKVFNFIKNEKTNLIRSDWFSFGWLVKYENLTRIIG